LNFWSKEKAMLKAISTIGNFGNVTLTSTDAGAGAGPLLDLYRNSASPAASDTIGEIEFNGQDSAGNKQQYAIIHASILSPTSTAETGQIHFETATAGASTEKMIIGTNNLVINDIGAIYNVRIEGDTDANLFFTDATNSRVGIGIITPAEKLDVVGNIKLTGNVIPASGFGIDFAATSGTGTSELLADYEEGTFTPVYVAQTGTLGTVTYAGVQGTYAKVGRLVTVTGGFYCSAFAAGTGSGDLRIGGLPFTNLANVNAISVGDSRLFTTNNPTGGQVGVSASTVTLFYRTTANGAINNLQVSDAATGSGALNLVYFTASYQV
jgi:hypothetical protein